MSRYTYNSVYRYRYVFYSVSYIFALTYFTQDITSINYYNGNKQIIDVTKRFIITYLVVQQDILRRYICRLYK